MGNRRKTGNRRNMGNYRNDDLAGNLGCLALMGIGALIYAIFKSTKTPLVEQLRELNLDYSWGAHAIEQECFNCNATHNGHDGYCSSCGVIFHAENQQKVKKQGYSANDYIIIAFALIFGLFFFIFLTSVS